MGKEAPKLPKEVKQKLEKHGSANWDEPDEEVIKNLDVKVTRFSDAHETSIYVDDKEEVIEVSATKGTSIRAMLRHPHADYKSVHLRLHKERPCIDTVWVELPIGCLTVKSKPRKNTLLSGVYAV